MGCDPDAPIPGRVIQWWVRRGWAFSVAVLLAVPAAMLTPPYPVGVSGWPTQAMFAVAAVAYLGCALDPESQWVRRTAAALGTFVTALRALTIAFDDDGVLPVRARMVGVASWLLAMLFCACAPEFTERYTRRGRQGWSERS